MKKLASSLLLTSFLFACNCDNSLLGPHCISGCSCSTGGPHSIVWGDHTGPCCKEEKNGFDAWNYDRNLSDRNITTKIVNRDFNITIAALNENGDDYKEFNGTVCSVVIDSDGNEISEWKKNSFRDNNTSDETDEGNPIFEVNKSVKVAKIHIEWLKNEDSDCPLDEETNETNSTDSFAVRPKSFDLTAPSVATAGSEFNITIKALDENGAEADEYNETLSTDGDSSPDLNYSQGSACLVGDFNKTAGGDFKDGKADVTLKYSEVGEVNISLREINGTEFAKIDKDDTPDAERLIEEKNVTIRFIPHHFEVNVSVENNSSFTYYDNDLNKSALIEINISAKNEENETTQNYNTQCYAKDIEVNLSLGKLRNGTINLSKLKYYYLDATDAKSAINEIGLNDVLTIDYKEGNWTTDNNGSTKIKIYFNFDRNYSLPSSPMEVNVSEVNVSDEDINLVYSTKEGNATFYYGKLLPQDIITYEDDENETIDILVFDTNFSDSLKPTSTEEEYNWYWNNLHQNRDGNVSNDEIVVSSDYNASNKIDGVDANVTSVSNGRIVIELKRSDGSIPFAVIHLLTPRLKWLWFSRYGDNYDISNNSTCLNHFCWTVTYEGRRDKGDAGTGEFKGTESNVTDYNVSGTKIYR